jgi:hypothetical protein
VRRQRSAPVRTAGAGLFSLQPWVDAGGKAHAICNALKKIEEERPVLVFESCEQLGLLFVSEAFRAAYDLAGIGGEVKGVCPSVGGVGAAFYEALCFQLVDERDHRVAVYSETVGKLLLRHALYCR